MEWGGRGQCVSVHYLCSFYIKFSTKLIYSYLPQISHRFLPYLKCKSTQCQFFFQEGGGMRVGSDYQAKVPEYKPGLCLQKKINIF